MASPHIFVLGIDGAPFDLVNRMMLDGELPHISSLASSGVFGPLQATIPPHTAPGWSSMFTGVSPGNHGIYQFWNLQSGAYAPPITSSSDFGWAPVWETLSDAGLSVGVCNVPMSHPPQALNGGWMISWPLAPSLHYSSPDSLIRDLTAEGVHYNTDFMTMWAGADDYPSFAFDLIRQRFLTIRHLMKTRPVDAVFFVVTEFDRIAHYHWKLDEPGEAVLDALRIIDEELGELLAELPDESTIILSSDHGFGACRGNVNINALFKEAGLLTVASCESNAKKAEGVFDSDGDSIGASWFGDAAGNAVDWSRTRAFMPAPGCYGVNLNIIGKYPNGCAHQSDMRAIQNEIEGALREVRDENGRAIFELLPRSEVYSGHRADAAPDLMLLPSDWGWMAHCSLDNDVMGPPTQLGVHYMTGIVGIRSTRLTGSLEADARMEDIAATILAACNTPLCQGIEGRPLAGIIETKLRLATSRSRTPGTTSPTASAAAAERRLASLGYL